MKSRETFEKIRNQRNGISLRVLLIIMVSAEVIAIVALSYGLSNLINGILPVNRKPPLLFELIILSLFIGFFVTGFISKFFFDPIKKLRKAMEKVADGDFKIRLDTNSFSQEIREVYAGFNLMVRELDATEILQSDFVSGVSHEFKTPINAIEGYAMLLQDCDNLTEQEREYVEKINFNTRRLSVLVGNMLLLSKIENQSIPTGKSCFSLDEQIRQSILVLEPQWVEKEIEFDVEMDSVRYPGNESILHHVWDNLIGNAIKFSPQGGMVRIRLTEKHAKIFFVIEDNGPGVPEDETRHIFDKFYQSDTSHKEEGNGLGLALVKRILDLSGGEIYVENIPKGGCRFTAILKTKTEKWRIVNVGLQ